MAFPSAIIGLLEISLALACFIILRRRSARYKNIVLPVNWPLIGMLPEFFVTIFQFYDRFIEVLDACNFSFRYKGPWLTGTDLLITVDPANVHYVMTRNFQNFPKGPEFHQKFDILGDGILNSDHGSWRDQRKLAQTVMNHDNFMRFSKETSHEKLIKGLLPILDGLSERGQVVDLQDLLQRFTFDATSVLVCGYDPKSLSGDFPSIPYATAMNEAEEAVVYRYVMPEWMWKLARWLDVGPERRLREAWETIDRVIGEYLSKKRRELAGDGSNDGGRGRFDMLSWYMGLGFHEDKFLRDTVLTFMTGGRDTTSAALSWFFWLLSENLDVKRKIIDEIETELFVNGQRRPWQDIIGKDKLVYLQAAMWETMRLYPPVPFELKSAAEPDTLPSGHRVDSKLPILFPLYPMGRMRAIWGEDCSEFKPERWITKTGGIKHEPSYKFPAFNAGPRTCLGKELAITQMKMVATVMVSEYEIEVVEGHPVEPCLSIILHMKHGLKVKVTKKSCSS